jgi:hypothetical protein
MSVWLSLPQVKNVFRETLHLDTLNSQTTDSEVTAVTVCHKYMNVRMNKGKNTSYFGTDKGGNMQWEPVMNQLSI